MTLVDTVKRLREIADAMAKSDKTNESLGEIYTSIYQLSYDLQDSYAGKKGL